MHEATKEALLALIGQLDAAGQLRLRLALVRQVMSYARLELGEWPNPAERACLDGVAGWLEQPADPASDKAITAQLAHELMPPGFAVAVLPPIGSTGQPCCTPSHHYV